MTEADTTIPPGLVGKIVKNRPLPEPILILEFGKYRPLANWEKSKSIYLADFSLFYVWWNTQKVRSTDVSKKTFILKHPSFSIWYHQFWS